MSCSNRGDFDFFEVGTVRFATGAARLPSGLGIDDPAGGHRALQFRAKQVSRRPRPGARHDIEVGLAVSAAAVANAIVSRRGLKRFSAGNPHAGLRGKVPHGRHAAGYDGPMSKTDEAVLAGMPLFASLKPKELRRLAGEAQRFTFGAGHHVTDEEGFGTAFVVIVEGSVEVSVHGNPVRQIGPGGYFGEMAAITRDARSATVVTQAHTTLLMYSRSVFRPFLITHPDVAWALLELMVERVRKAESRVVPAAEPSA
jgi:Cyclic nucleotide-binding domain